jgi:hypothetical protein
MSLFVGKKETEFGVEKVGVLILISHQFLIIRREKWEGSVPWGETVAK